MIQLEHPKYGICAQEMISPYKTIELITYQWSMKYGQKFYECGLVITSYSEDEKSFTRPIAIYANPAHSHSEELK